LALTLRAVCGFTTAQIAHAFVVSDAHGLVLLPDQDRGRRDRTMIADALALLDRAAALHRPGPYQLQAAIGACHTEARTWPDTDWPQILALYDLLLAHAPWAAELRALALTANRAEQSLLRRRLDG
jgi:predicted RNA polymerase sigma factor